MKKEIFYTISNRFKISINSLTKSIQKYSLHSNYIILEPTSFIQIMSMEWILYKESKYVWVYLTKSYFESGPMRSPQKLDITNY